MCPQYFRQSSPIIFNFILSSVHWGRIQDIEFERHGLPLPVRYMGKPFKVSINYFDLFVLQRVTFCFCLFSKLSLATTTSVDACLVFVFHLTSFNYDGKGARDVGLTCRCHLSNLMPDSIFNDWWRQRITFFFLI